MSDRIQKARDHCIKLHEGQIRKHSGEPYHVHPFAVAHKVKQCNNASENLIIAAYLHDVIEDCFDGDLEKGREYVSNYFGEDVSDIVWGVTNQSKKSDGSRATRKAIDAAHLENGTAEIKTLKLADIWHNCHNLHNENPEMAAYYIPEKRKVLPLLKEGDEELYKEVEEILWRNS